MGMNAIRFYMNYETFEDDSKPFVYKQTGWEWIDQNIQWAKNNGIYLILNMHVPQGGFQSQCKGEALWDDMENQNRLTGLWKAIAERYKNEPQVAAYDLVNEPTPKSSVNQWFTLCNRLVDSVRAVDSNHLIITERAIAVNCDYDYNDGNYNYPPLTEENLMYTVHMYEPFNYTHQLQDWAGTGEGGKYPDNSIVTMPRDLTYATGNYTNTILPTGNSDWTLMRGTPFLVDNDTLIALRATLGANSLRSGVAYYDDITVYETTVDGTIIQELASDNFTGDETIWNWSQNNDLVRGTSTDGHDDGFSYTVTGTSNYGSVTIASTELALEKGKYYAINGWYKGENIPTGASASITTEFYHSPSRSPYTSRNKEFLSNQIVAYSEYIESLGYPVYFGEFGVVRETFENDRGGDNWVRDCIDIFDSLGYHFTYHAWREGAFGIYENDPVQPIDTTTLNVDLYNVFKDYFDGATLSIDEIIDQNNRYKAYPQPADNTVHVSGKDIDYVRLYDMNGQFLGENKNNAIRVDSIPGGAYLLLIYNKEDELLSSKKIIK